jgi:transposase
MKAQSSPTRSGSTVYKTSGRRPRIDLAALEKRRIQAGEMFDRGAQPAEVARNLGVSCQAACNWRDSWRHGGVEGLKTPRMGRPAKLTTEQLKEVEKVLLEGARASGYTTDLWTLRRVAEVIERVTAVTYSVGHVWRVLRYLGWSRQRPTRRAVERDEVKIAHWIKDRWAKVKKTPDEGEPGSFLRMKAASR